MKKYFFHAKITLVTLTVFFTTSVFAGTGVSSEDALVRLQNGNMHYVYGTHTKKNLAHDRKANAKSQHPYAIIVTCADSRVSPEHVFDEGLGQLFVIRNAGNVIDSTTLGSIEYAAEHLHAKLLVIMGHQSCGAVKATVEGGDFTPNIISIAKKIAPAVEKVREKNIPEGNFLAESVAENVRYQMLQTLEKSDLLRELVEKHELQIAGSVYSLETGKVEFFETKNSKKKHLLGHNH